MFGDEFNSKPPLGARERNKCCRANAIATVAAALIPNVFEKISIEKPNKNPKIRTNQPGVSKGSKMINKIYRYGFKYPLN